MPNILAEPGSGNVFADLGVPEPELALAKAKLCAKIYETIRARGWTQRRAAAAMGVDQPKVSEIIHGRVRSYTIDRLIGYLERLGYGVRFSFHDLRPDARKVRPSGKARPTVRRQTMGRKSANATSAL